MTTPIVPATENATEILGLLGRTAARRVLFVSDQPILRRSFVRATSPVMERMPVTTCASLREALDLARVQEFAAVAAADTVEGSDGISVLEAFLQRFPDTNRIYVTQNTNVDATMEAVNRTLLYGIVVLPWEPDSLRHTLLRACDNFALRHENKQLAALLDQEANQLDELAARLADTVQERTASLLTGLIAALDLRDTETQGHSRRVALYAKRLAREYGVSEQDAVDIERGALLHDIGKIGVSDTILLKPGKLTEEEWVIMRTHAEKGYRILENIPFLGNAREIVYAHHERFDGKGYPRGLAGEDIILGARIFAIIDTYDAMTSDRPYRKGLPHEVAMEEIDKNAGTQFDPKLVACWRRIPKEELFALRKRAEEDVFAGAI